MKKIYFFFLLINNVLSWNPTNYPFIPASTDTSKIRELIIEAQGKNKRILDTTAEVLYVQKGVLIVNFYESPDKCEVDQSYSLEEGDLILLSGGIHGFEIGEDCRFLEIKQGPFKASGDKVKLYD